MRDLAAKKLYIMSDFKQRLETEKTELVEKMTKLSDFTKTDNFVKIEPIQQSLLLIQLKAMQTYDQCLAARLTWLG